MRRVLDWLDERCGWRKLKETLLDRKIPKGVNWNYTLGSVLLFLFVMQAVTGMILAMYYSPSPDHAYQSVQFMDHHVLLGWLVRGLHHWGASAMVLVAFLHLLRTYFMAAYKYPREMTWISGVGLLLIVVGFGFTGYLLPWDEKAYWATMVGSRMAGQVPLLGAWLSRVLKGGDELGAMTLTRFYSIHMLVLPACFLLLVAVHLFLVVWHGISAPPERLDKDEKEEWKKGRVADWKERARRRYAERKAQGKSFFPYIISKDMLAVVLALVVLAWMAVRHSPTLDPMADPTATTYNPRPEWYFLFIFQFLKYFPGKLEAVATVALPILAIGLLLALPFLDFKPFRHLKDRPWMTVIGAVVVVGIAFLTVQAVLSPPVNQGMKVDPEVAKGKLLFQQLRCQSCHSVNGVGGVVGPALDLVAQRRSRDWLAAHFRNPSKISPGTKMPNFHLLDSEVDALTAYMCTLGGGPYSANAAKLLDSQCLDCHSLRGKGDNSAPDLTREGLTHEQAWIAQYIKNPNSLYKDAEMPAFGKALTPAQIEDLSRYLAAQRGEATVKKIGRVK